MGVLHVCDPHPSQACFLTHPFRAVKKKSLLNWHFAVLVKDRCSWEDPSMQVSVSSVQTSLLLMLQGDRMHLTPEM